MKLDIDNAEENVMSILIYAFGLFMVGLSIAVTVCIVRWAMFSSVEDYKQEQPQFCERGNI